MPGYTFSLHSLLFSCYHYSILVFTYCWSGNISLFKKIHCFVSLFGLFSLSCSIRSIVELRCFLFLLLTVPFAFLLALLYSQFFWRVGLLRYLLRAAFLIYIFSMHSSSKHFFFFLIWVLVFLSVRLLLSSSLTSKILLLHPPLRCPLLHLLVLHDSSAMSHLCW